jgi:thiamine-monophosphate kinase
MDDTTLADAGELELLKRLECFLPSAGAGPGGRLELGAGDDAALWQPLPGNGVAITTDTMVEGTHFHRPADVAGMEGLGWKLVAVSLSDIAAMGARPGAVFLALSLPSSWKVTWLEALVRGAELCARTWGCSIAGGNLASAPVTVLTSTVAGSVDPAAALRREGIQPGWGLAVTGTLGGAGAALRARSEGRPVDLAWAERLDRPQPRVEAGLALREAGIRVAMDVSDGLFLDAGRLLERAAVSGHGSRPGLLLEASELPLAADIRESWPQAWLELAGAGEDYELLFAGPPELLVEGCAAVAATGLGATRIGTFDDAHGLRIRRDGRVLEPPGAGYVHFLGAGD